MNLLTIDQKIEYLQGRISRMKAYHEHSDSQTVRENLRAAKHQLASLQAKRQAILDSRERAARNSTEQPVQHSIFQNQTTLL